MATVAIDRHQSANAWPSQPQFNARTRFQTGPPTYIQESEAPLQPHNHVELTRDMLISVLEYFSQLVGQLFGRGIRMVVHGGACMLLHPGLSSLSQQQQQMIPSLPRRTTTRDVDYIHRSFLTELASWGLPDATVKLQECIKSTARYFGLGADWMNSDADIALPMARDPSGKVYDPIYAASIKQNNIELHTIFRSNNGMLTLISVTPFWAVSLKLVRYIKWDPGDICLLLRNGMVLSGTNWTPEVLESWLFRNCWPMGYHNFDSGRKADLRARILHAIELLSKWTSAVNSPGKAISAHDAMGGGDVMGGGEHEDSGWNYFFGKWPNQQQQLQPQPQQQAPLGSVQFPIPNSAPAPAPAPVNVRDWINDDVSPPKKSRPPSPRSRQNSTGKPREIFIPPDTDWNAHIPTPDHVDDRWYPAESNHFRSGSRPLRADPYSVESFDRSLSSMLHQSRQRSANLAIPSNTQPVIPVNVTRKQDKKRRKKDRKRDRELKRIPLLARRGSDSDDSSSEDDDEPSRMPTWYSQPATMTTTAHQQQPPQMRLPPAPPMHSQNRSHSYSQQDAAAPGHHHPPHLNHTSSGPAPVSGPPQGQANHMHIGLHSPPQSFGPAQLAQYQFEQQQQVYQFQQQQQQQQQQRYHHQQPPQPQSQPQPPQYQQQYHYQRQQSSWNNGNATVYR